MKAIRRNPLKIFQSPVWRTTAPPLDGARCRQTWTFRAGKTQPLAFEVCGEGKKTNSPFAGLHQHFPRNGISLVKANFRSFVSKSSCRCSLFQVLLTKSFVFIRTFSRREYTAQFPCKHCSYEQIMLVLQ